MDTHSMVMLVMVCIHNYFNIYPYCYLLIFFFFFLNLLIVLFIFISDINECEERGCCPKPGTCMNTLGSFKCICPRGFKLDRTGKFCTDNNECADDESCEHGCQVLVIIKKKLEQSHEQTINT